MQAMSEQFFLNYDYHLDLSGLITPAQLRFKSQITKAKTKESKTAPKGFW